MVKKLPLFLTNLIGWKLLLKTAILSVIFLFAYSRGFSFFSTVLFVFSFLIAYISEFEDRKKYKVTFFSLVFSSFISGKLMLFGEVSEMFSWIIFSLFFLTFFILFADIRILFPKRDVSAFLIHIGATFLTIFSLFLGISFSIPSIGSTIIFTFLLFLLPFFLFQEYARNRGFMWKSRIRVLAGVFGLVLVEFGLSMLFLPILPIFSAVLFAGTALFVEQLAILHLGGGISRRTMFLYMLCIISFWGMTFFFTSIL